MLKRKFSLLFVVAVMLLCHSCTRATIFIDDHGESFVPVEFAPQISGVTTRASGTEWEVGDRLGIFMLEHGTALQTTNIIDDADNRCYEVSGSGAHVHLVSTDPDYAMYYPVDGSEVDFVAYYPYHTTGTTTGGLNNYIYPVRIDNQSDFAAIDLLYGTGTGSKRDKTVAIVMAHQLSKIRVVVNKATELSGLDLTDTQVTLDGMPLASGFDLATTTFDYLNESGMPETGRLLTQTIAEGLTYEAIVLPQSAGQFPGREVAFALGEGNGGFLPYAYKWSIPDGTVFRPGKEYTYNFTLRASGVDFSSLTISDWDDYSFEATAVEMVSIPGGMLNGSTPVDGFMISRFPITNSQYAAFLNSVQVAGDGMLEGELLIAVGDSKLICSGETRTTPPFGHPSSGRRGVGEYRWCPAMGYEEHPVTGVSWYGAQAFATWQGGGLPTETQWEYACRGSSSSGSEALHPGSPDGETTGYTGTAYCFGDEVSRLPKYAWYEANNNTIGENNIGTKEVGTRLMNAFTLYDMHGNVWEWCADWYTPNTHRALRGGAFDSTAEECRSDYRNGATPGSTAENRGFRIIRVEN